MRAQWDVAKYLRTGRLAHVLPAYDTPPADLYAVYPERLNLSTKVTCFVDYLRNYLGQRADGPSPVGAKW
ncbi:LysR family transcriptional regulator [Pandoraea cepalis]|uniref:LysR family transcriptional regulator n=1 Tax=Pandoraea cepalis TaxID=2508294 RepID=A0A5E4W015_9BURK|nr:LysR family transcriptional regulator [Pandoraea cepalis]